MNNDKLILIYYISVIGIDRSQFEEYFQNLKNKIAAQSISEDSEIIFVPVNSETRIECINPKYITDSNLIKKHERLMSQLHEHLDNQLDQIVKEDK